MKLIIDWFVNMDTNTAKLITLYLLVVFFAWLIGVIVWLFLYSDLTKNVYQTKTTPQYFVGMKGIEKTNNKENIGGYFIHLKRQQQKD